MKRRGQGGVWSGMPQEQSERLEEAFRMQKLSVDIKDETVRHFLTIMLHVYNKYIDVFQVAYIMFIFSRRLIFIIKWLTYI